MSLFIAKQYIETGSKIEVCYVNRSDDYQTCSIETLNILHDGYLSVLHILINYSHSKKENSL